MDSRRFHASTVSMALRIAIEEREKEEKRQGYTGDSALLATWRQLHRELSRATHVRLEG